MSARHEFFALFTVPSNAGMCTKSIYCLINLILTPVLLIGRSYYIYILPCIGSFFHFLFLKCLQACGCVKSCYKPFTDPEFPPNNKSLGNDDLHKWARLSQMVVKHRSGRDAPADCLFNDSISAKDIAQGAMGDCWLMAAIATLCERPALISNCFVTRAFNPFGKYKIRLFDQSKNKFVILTIDDYVPVNPTTLKPMYSHLITNEIWPLLLEKAYAKLKGSYEKLNGGLPLDAMRTLTGYSGEHIILSNDKKSNEASFKKLQYYFNSGCLIAAGSKGQDKSRTEGRDKVKGSIVGGHAYSVLAIKSPTLTTAPVHLLKLRNPWGTFSWHGDWADESPLWLQHPGVMITLGKPKGSEEGIFYMSWESFSEYFSLVDVLFPSVSVDKFSMVADEGHKMTGGCLGACKGCCYFWCLCRGARVLWLHEESEHLKQRLQKETQDKFFSHV